MKEPLTLYIGAVRRGEFESLSRQNVALGIILDAQSTIKQPDLSAFCVIASCDFHDGGIELLTAVEYLKQTWDIQSVLVTYEQYVLPAVQMTRHLGLPGLSLSAAQLCLDKTAMHERFVQRLGADSTGNFAPIESQQDLRAFASRAHFPIVLKPANLYTSLFVSLSFSQEELLSNYSRMMSNLTAFFQKTDQPRTAPRIQAEEFLAGTVHSLDCIVGADGQVRTTPVVDAVTGRDIGWSDFHHFARFVPSKLTAEQQQHLLQLALAGIKALEITSSVAHVEVIETSRGPRLLEIGARPGGNRSRLFSLSSGFDLMHHYHQVRLGRSPATGGNQQSITPTAIVSPYARRAGTLICIERLADIQRLSTYLGHEQKIASGQPAGPSISGYTTPLLIELQASHPQAIDQDLEILQSWQDLFRVAEDQRQTSC